MKIAVASDDGKVISAHFGRSLGFVIAEIENREIKTKQYRKNTFTGHARGLADEDCNLDRHQPILEALKDCQIVISHGMGRRIYDDLKNAAIGVFITEEVDVDEALSAFIKGELKDHPERGCVHESR